MRKDRQQRQNVKARKAKAKALAAKSHRSWIGRKDHPVARSLSPFGAAANQAALMARLTRLSRDSVAEREASERFLCRLFGEEYRP